jgi:phage tail-like protein
MALSQTEQRAQYPLAAYNFRVMVDGVDLSFTEISGLTKEYETVTYKHGLSFWEGESITKFRYDKYVDLTMKRGVVNGLNELYRWIDAVEKKSMTISLCDDRGLPVITWEVKKAILVKMEAPSLQASSNEVYIETLTWKVAGISVK